MLTIFNRKELFITMDMKREAEIRKILSQNNIDYHVTTKNLQGGVIGRGGFGINHNYSCEYKIYVHKDDYDRARYLIGQEP